MTKINAHPRFFAQVLDQGSVEIIDTLPYPTRPTDMDMAVVSAARTSLLLDSTDEIRDRNLIRYLMSHQHTSPFEQAIFKFRIKAPVLVWWQLVRHRTASINMQSGRYTPFEEDQYYTPDLWRMQSASNKQGSDGVMDEDVHVAIFKDLIQKSGYDEIIRQLIENAESVTDVFQRYFDAGYAIYEALLKNGIAREQARLFLPGFALYYTGIWTMDAHNLMHFLKLRMTKEAQYEIREYATVMYKMFSTLMPWTAESFTAIHIDKE